MALQSIECNAHAFIKNETDVKAPFNYNREIGLTRVFLAFTVCVWLIVSWQMGVILFDRIRAGGIGSIAEQTLFIIIIQALIYGNFVYQLTRMGYLRRRMAHKPMTVEAREAIYENAAPSLAILIPSYKEEISVVKRTLMSAALQDYPNRRIVLLIDDPVNPANPWDQRALDAARSLTHSLQVMFNEAAAPFIQAEREFLAKLGQRRVDVSLKAQQLAHLYDQAAYRIEGFAQDYQLHDHGDQLLLDKVFKPLIAAHRARAQALRQAHTVWTMKRIRREFARLAGLFHVEFTSFERKRYVNLSHEPNKAMNLNSYIRLLGSAWHSVKREDGEYLEPAEHVKGAINVPAADFLITLDADSLLVPEYALVLINEMHRKGNERLAVAQTPYNTIPHPASDLERVAGATTDIQYLIHQGFTHYNATYWVGANALLRTAALGDIKTTTKERGFEMPVYIQDRTVIEDTESSVDLVDCGWRLFNYPERLAFSATPADFGSLLIQRRRWANGGLIILPKLLRYMARRPSLAKMKEGFFRVHYLSSIALVNVGLLILLCHPFEHSIEGMWLPLTALPYYVLYARDLRYNGYRMRDLLGVYALNLMLIPINMGGVLKSIEQGISGKKIPFGRTPKIAGRTHTPSLYCLFELTLPLFCLVMAIDDALHGKWLHAVFAAVNGAIFMYGIIRLIGMCEILQDLLAPLYDRPPVEHTETLKPAYRYQESPRRIKAA